MTEFEWQPGTCETAGLPGAQLLPGSAANTPLDRLSHKHKQRGKNLQPQDIIWHHYCAINKTALQASPAADEHIPAGKAETCDSLNWMCPFKSTGSRSNAQ